MNFLNANWENIVMANYAVPANVLQPYLPKGCELDLYNNTAYVSLVGFMFKNTKLFQIPIPWFGTFEEINLRFYVTRKEGNILKRGVVFINETIPYKLVAWVANKLYKEHYTSIPTKHTITASTTHKYIEYQWKRNKVWNSIFVEASSEKQAMVKDSFEEFIFEHYYGYTKVSEFTTEEYQIDHPRWNINEIKTYQINCDFNAMYGKSFGFLTNSTPYSVFLAEGSAVGVEWERNKLTEIQKL